AAVTVHVKPQCVERKGRCPHWHRRRFRRSVVGIGRHANGELFPYTTLFRSRKVSAKEVAVEERVHVVATWRAYAVGPAGGRVKRTTGEIADRRHIEPVSAWRQTHVQSGNLHHVFDKPEPAPASRSNYRRHCHAAGNQRAAVPFGHALTDFPEGAGNIGIRQIVREDGCHTPSGTGDDEIVINTGELAAAQRGVVLVSKAVN